VRDALAPVIQEIIPANMAGKADVKFATNEASIYVLNGPWGASADDFVHHGFIPVLNGPADIAYWSLGEKKPAVLHIDTGMSRLGLTPEQAERLAGDRVQLRNIDVRYIMSHLACGDESQHPKNAEQLALFKRLTAALEIPARDSFANSAGIMLGPDYHFDLVRPGCGLYGINPAAGPNPVRGVASLRARIVQVRDVPAGETVGYSQGYKAERPTRVATCGAGYADGVLRSYSPKGQVFIAGEMRPIIGRVSMDVLAVDVTGLDVKAGDLVEIFGANRLIDDAAAAAGTISYELLTSITPRVPRVYQG
jgi:alanine racemase